MSFQEKSAWVLIIATAIIGGLFVFGLAEDGGIAAQGNIFSAIILFVILVVVMHIAIAILNPKAADTSDERDRQIERKAEMAGGFTLGGFMLLILAMASISGDWHIANLAFIGLLASELIKGLWQIALYRLSA